MRQENPKFTPSYRDPFQTEIVKKYNEIYLDFLDKLDKLIQEAGGHEKLKVYFGEQQYDPNNVAIRYKLYP